MKVFIVDDEPPAVRAIEALLEQHEGDFPVEVIGTSNDSEEAIEWINKVRPDVLFLDVEMPGLTGFELLEKINYKDLMVIFVTAYRDYAVDAFKANAIHYIVKPISPKAFNHCLERINEKLEQKQFNMTGLNRVLDRMHEGKIAIKSKDGYSVLPCEEVVSIKSEGSYSEFHLENGKKLVQSKNLKHSSEGLPKDLFKRISRSAIINIEKVVSFSFQDGGSICLSNGENLLVGKTYRNETFALLKDKFVM